MTEVNLTHDPILLLLLKNIIRASSRVSVHDAALNQKINELTYFDQHPGRVVYEQLTSTIDRLAEILAGYELKDHQSSKNDSNVEEQEGSIGSLPGTIFNFKNRLVDLKTKTDLDSKHFTLAELEVKIEQFCKLAESK